MTSVLNSWLFRGTAFALLVALFVWYQAGEREEMRPEIAGAENPGPMPDTRAPAVRVDGQTGVLGDTTVKDDEIENSIQTRPLAETKVRTIGEVTESLASDSNQSAGGGIPIASRMVLRSEQGVAVSDTATGNAVTESFPDNLTTNSGSLPGINDFAEGGLLPGSGGGQYSGPLPGENEAPVVGPLPGEGEADVIAPLPGE